MSLQIARFIKKITYNRGVETFFAEGHTANILKPREPKVRKFSNEVTISNVGAFVVLAE